MPTNLASTDSSIILTRVPLFVGLRPEDLSRIHSLGRRRKTREGEWLFRQGEGAKTMFLLAEGRVRVTQATPTGQQIVLHLVKPGDMFGCSAMLRERQYPGSAEVVAEGCVECFEEAALRMIERDYPEVTRNALALMAGRVRDLRQRYQELATERVEPRIAHTLLRLADEAGVPDARGGRRIALRLSRQDLAELAGTTMFTVSRTLKAWAELGLVDIGRQRVRVIDSAALAALVAEAT